jgi:hypothetical protein
MINNMLIDEPSNKRVSISKRSLQQTSKVVDEEFL